MSYDAIQALDSHQTSGGHPYDDTPNHGAYWGSFVIRFLRRVPMRRFDFERGETLVVHDRQIEAAKCSGELAYDGHTIPEGSYELIVHYPACKTSKRDKLSG